MSSESLSGSRSGAASTTIQNAESVKFGGKLCLSFQTIAGFWQAPESDAFLDGALFSKAQIVDCFSTNIELQVWRKTAEHASSLGMEKRIITDFARNARHQLIKERKCLAVRALDFLVCAAINEKHCLCIRCEQHVLAYRKHELWACPAHNLIAHEHLEKSANILQLAQELWDSDQILFSRGMVPRVWLPANDYTDCMEARLWGSKEFGEDADKDLFVASDGSGGSNETLKKLETGRFEGGHFLVLSWGRPTRPVF